MALSSSPRGSLSFVSLPGEMRNEIYSYICTFWRDVGGSPASLLAAHPAIYREAQSMLYADPNVVRIHARPGVPRALCTVDHRSPQNKNDVYSATDIRYLTHLTIKIEYEDNTQTLQMSLAEWMEKNVLVKKKDWFAEMDEWYQCAPATSTKELLARRLMMITRAYGYSVKNGSIRQRTRQTLRQLERNVNEVASAVTRSRAMKEVRVLLYAGGADNNLAPVFVPLNSSMRRLLPLLKLPANIKVTAAFWEENYQLGHAEGDNQTHAKLSAAWFNGARERWANLLQGGNPTQKEKRECVRKCLEEAEAVMASGESDV